MSETARLIQFRIWNDDASGVELTFDHTDIVGLPEFGWSTPRPLEGKIESIPSVIRVLDTGEQVSTELGDVDGRSVLMYRVADIRYNDNGAGYSVVYSGRVTAIVMADDVVSFDFHISDERSMEKRFDVFASGGTTSLIPAGVVGTFLDMPPAATIDLKVSVVRDANRILCTVIRRAHAVGADPEEYGSPYISQETIDSLKADAKYTSTNAGGFEFTRCFAGGADREIWSFGDNVGGPLAPVFALELLAENGEPLKVTHIELYWPSHGKSVGNNITGAYVYQPGAPASTNNPVHEDLQDFFSWLKDRYDDKGIRYESDAFSAYNESTNPNGLIGHFACPFFVMRATKVWSLRDVVERYCASVGLIPFTNKLGEVAPRFTRLLHDVDPTGLVQVTSPKFTKPHPTWMQESNDIVTVVTMEYSRYRHVTIGGVRANQSAPPDRIQHDKISNLPAIEHDRVDELGRHVHHLDMGFHASVYNNPDSYGFVGSFQFHGREILDRYGDGPIRGAFRGLSATDALDAGSFCVIDLSSFPNPAVPGRGGQRVVQVMGRRQESALVFDYLDAGPDDQPLQAPGVAIVKGASNSFNEVDVTISSLAAGSTYELQLRNAVGGLWYNAGVGDADETVTITRVPSGTAIYARAREAAPNRIRSEWSAAVNATTDTLPVCTGLSVDNEAGDRAEFSWTVGSADYPLEILLDGDQYATLAPGTSFYLMRSLTVSTTYNSPGFQVRHFDDYGGEGTLATQVFTTTGTPTQLIEPFALAILVGGQPV